MLIAAMLGVAATNLLAFLVYGFDKHRAREGDRRISEGTLILFAILGGVGAWLGCEMFRHKTRKQPFRAWLIVALAMHLGLVITLIALLPR